MRILVSILILIVPGLSYSQTRDTLLHKADGAFTKYQNKLDSIQGRKNARIDSLDSKNKSLNTKIRDITSFDLPGVSSLDTLQSGRKSFSKLDSAKIRLTSKIDSLRGLGIPAYSLQQKLDSLNQSSSTKKILELDGKISQLQNDINSKLSEPANKVNDKLNVLSKESEGYGTLPGNVTSPSVNGGLPDAPGLNINTPSVPTKSNENTFGNVEVNPDINVNPKIGNLPDATSKLTGGLDNVSEVSQDISTYAEDAKNISSGNLSEVKQIDKDIVAKLPNEELKAVQGELGAASDQIEAMKALKNYEAFKQQTLKKAQEVIVQQLALHESKVAESVNKISQHQKRAGTLFSKVKGLPKRPRKEKKPPVIERFVPGITIQVQKNNNWFIDINPTLRYRIKSIFSAGLGWNERAVFDKDFDFHKESRIYGFRSFYELSVLKGIWIRADVERMNAFVPINRMSQDIGERKQVWSYMAGIKKEFSFVPGVVGNVQFMYNLYDPGRTSPYFNRFNVRFGFEFPLKKNAQKKSVSD